jgi:hypothetical protein
MQSNMITLFADYSGAATQKSEEVIVYCVLVVEDQPAKEIEKQMLKLANGLQNKGLHLPIPFEFHTQEILHGSGAWRSVKKDVRIGILREIRTMILDLKIPIVLVLVDRREGGFRSIQQLSEITKVFDESEEIKKKFRDRLEREAPGISIEKLKSEPLTYLIGMLFGLTNGMLNYLGIKQRAQLIADEQFVRQTYLWKAIFVLLRSYWQTMVGAGLFFTWSSEEQPTWQIADDITQVESIKSFGVQVADYVAFTTRLTRLHDMQDPQQLAVLQKQNLVSLMPGIYAGVANYQR